MEGGAVFATLGAKLRSPYQVARKDLEPIRELSATNGLSAQSGSQIVFEFGDHTGPVTLNVNLCGQP